MLKLWGFIFYMLLAELNLHCSISRCCAAARALQAYSAAKVNPSMHLMVAYKERTEQLNQLTDRFIEKLMAHMSALFSNLVRMLCLCFIQ